MPQQTGTILALVENRRKAEEPLLNVFIGYLCPCDLCQRHRRLDSIKAKLPKEDADWLEQMACHLLDVESDLEWRTVEEAEGRKIPPVYPTKWQKFLIWLKQSWTEVGT